MGRFGVLHSALLEYCQGAVYMAAKSEVFPTLPLKMFTHFTFPLRTSQKNHTLLTLISFHLTNQASTMGDNQLLQNLFWSLLKTPYCQFVNTGTHQKTRLSYIVLHRTTEAYRGLCRQALFPEAGQGVESLADPELDIRPSPDMSPRLESSSGQVLAGPNIGLLQLMTPAPSCFLWGPVNIWYIPRCAR